MSPCIVGTAILCGQHIRLTHMTTGRNLHTHLFTAPMSGHQEVSAFGENGEGDGGDYWIVRCDTGKWRRMEDVQFVHVDTKAYLGSSHMHKYNRPVEGQLEIHAKRNVDRDCQWFADEGFYLKAQGKV